jgi:hypothetical protein
MAVDKMSWATISLQSARICAFCKYWWDPACTCIRPQNMQFWQYEASAKCRCLKRGADMAASASCGMFRYKSILCDL